MKDKRKTRLNKTQGTKTEFVGFGAFANPASTSCAASGTNTGGVSSPNTNNNNNKQASLRWSPVYVGKDSNLATLVFPRLMKRDATTKVKALQELQEFFRRDDYPKKQQVDALAHYMFVYHSKLTYDSSSSVRAEALLVLTMASQRVPKAFSTLAQQNNQQILGMMYCCNGDPAAEVRTMVSKNMTDVAATSTAYSLEDLEGGLWSYVQRILSYGRANKMQEDLFATTWKSSSSSSSSKRSNSKATSTPSLEELNESQKDQLEEKFERIVGTALSGMQVWIQRHGIVGTTTTPSNNNDTDEGDNNNSNKTLIQQTSQNVLWKTLSSPKSSLRRKTYSLLAICCQKAPSLIFDNQQAFSQALPQALASEKEPGNIAALLEGLLTFLAAYSKYNNNNNNNASSATPSSSPWDKCLNSDTVTKSLVKIFKKSCYGASATQWGPTLLPLLAMLPALPDQVSVLSAAWKGREHSVRLGDHLVVVQTVSESASLFLLRKQQQEETKSTTTTKEDDRAKDSVIHAKELAQLWIDCLRNFLETKMSSSKSGGGGPVQQAQIALAKGLAKEIRQFDEDRPNSAVHLIRDWLWNEQVRESILTVTEYSALAMLVQQINKRQSSSVSSPSPSTSPSSQLCSILSEEFRKVLSPFQDRSGSVPTEDAYGVLIAILRYCGITQVFPQNNANGGDGSSSSDENHEEAKMTAEKFLMNDVLRWMVIHTSSLSTQQQTKVLAQNDFILFGICAEGLQSEEARLKQWEALLREMVAAKCRLDLLIAGLDALLRQDKSWNERIKCELLDQFAIQVVGDLLESGARNNKPAETHAEDDYNDDERTAVKDFLVTVAGLRINSISLVRPTVIQTWVDMACDDHGDAIVPSCILETLVAISSVVPSRLSEGDILRILLQCWRQGGDVWTKDAIGLLSKEPQLLSALYDQAPQALESTVREWSSKPGDEKSNEMAVLWSERAWRLLALSRESSFVSDAVVTPSLKLVKLSSRSIWESSTRLDFPFACLMRLLGKAPNPTEPLKLLQSDESSGGDFIVGILIALSGASKEGITASRTSRQRDRCAQLLSVLGGRSQLGKQLLGSWLKATVARMMKLIELGESGDICKAVAVTAQICHLMIDRVVPVDILKADEDDDDDEDLSEEFEREKIAKVIVPVLTSQTFLSLPWSSSVPELVNVIIFHCGVGGDRGIGSLHYDMFQLVLGTEGRLRKHLTNQDEAREADVIQDVWKLSLCCGYGLNVPFSTWNSLLAFDPDKITALILDYYDKQETRSTPSDFARAVLSWLITAGRKLKAEALLSRSLRHLYKESISILSKNSGFNNDTLLALRGIHVAQAVSINNKPDHEGLAVQAVMRTIKAFVVGWENLTIQVGVVGQAFDAMCTPSQSIQPAWRELSHFDDIIAFTIARGGDFLVSSASDFVDELVKSLFVVSKRWYAFRLLAAIAKSAQLQGDPTPEDDTTRRLAEWTSDMDEEGKSELEEDVEIVCEILPHHLMAEMESWAEEDYSDMLDDKVIIGRMLVWLCCLNFVDAYVRKDPSNRPSLCAYLDKSSASESILNQTLLHTGVGTEKGGAASPTVDADQLLNSESLLGRVSLASLVLFRTVETLPQLSRRWWEQECPNVYTTPIRNYIEAQVAPKILEKELERLKFATIKNRAMSDLTVTGSVTTREITATYTQDEINLKVSIVLPSFYPLRNAEVDCSQTLGIPAKRWKLWSLQITMMLNTQGGTLQEALMLWKENVDQEFDGVEPCPVCYSVLHVKTHKLPELECTTCSNRFHTQCLTQWFRSSGKTQCVLCQQPWVGTKVKR